MKVQLGGNRLGSGNKVDQELHNYYRSTHNLSQRFTSSMTCGTLVPFLVIPTLRGDVFDIDLNAAARTRPTVAPLFGSFKMQIDLFHADVRLYQALLHNNPIDLGLKTNQIMMPTIWCKQGQVSGESIMKRKFNTSSLMSYLGVKGLGIDTVSGTCYRDLNAVPVLAYYDIYKNYYANKQETNAYIVSGGQVEIEDEPLTTTATSESSGTVTEYDAMEFTNIDGVYKCVYQFEVSNERAYPIMPILTIQFDNGNYTAEEIKKNVKIQISAVAFTPPKDTLENQEKKGAITFIQLTNDEIQFKINYNSTISQVSIDIPESITRTGLKLQQFALKNLDDMRMALLSKHTLGTPFKIGNISGSEDWTDTSGTDQSGLPYSALYQTREDNKSYNNFAMNGLAIKTYQSDIYNNWLNTEWIDGQNGIRAITAVAVSDNKFTIDALQLAEKLYNLLNRVAVSGGTYEDWLDAVYTQMPHRHIETPIYLGGMSNEIIFDEIIQTTPTEGAALGTMGGRGVLVKRKGGKVHVKVSEPGFLIGIVSITPRINYHQGNEFYMTDIKTIDDLHKPELDQIGFQNLIGERLAWWDTKFRNGLLTSRSAIGKIPAWLEYMTAVDKSYGDFADEEGKAFMVLNRNYEENDGDIKDATTYVDPTKFNYAFAYTAIDAQNFWVCINSKIIARRVMSAKQIPNI